MVRVASKSIMTASGLCKDGSWGRHNQENSTKNRLTKGRTKRVVALKVPSPTSPCHAMGKLFPTIYSAVASSPKYFPMVQASEGDAP